MHVFVPVWRPDTSSARRLFGFSDALSDEDVVKAVEQVRHQRAGTTRMPPWLQALAGYAWLGANSDTARWVADTDESVVLRQLAKDLDDEEDTPIVVFDAADQLVKQLKMRLLVRQMPANLARNWGSRFRDGAAWQPIALASEHESADAILTLATGHELYNPWQQEPQAPAQACAQALALRELYKKDWI